MGEGRWHGTETNCSQCKVGFGLGWGEIRRDYDVAWGVGEVGDVASLSKKGSWL